MIELKERHCKPVAAGDKPLNSQEVEMMMEYLISDWRVVDGKKLRLEFIFESFKRAMAFVQEIAFIAEKENHHPDICIHYTKLIVELTTKDIDGLSENDFIMAAKIENL